MTRERVNWQDKQTDPIIDWTRPLRIKETGQSIDRVTIDTHLDAPIAVYIRDADGRLHMYIVARDGKSLPLGWHGGWSLENVPDEPAEPAAPAEPAEPKIIEQWLILDEYAPDVFVPELSGMFSSRVTAEEYLRRLRMWNKRVLRLARVLIEVT